jgi:hypothetical protein
MAVRDKLRVSGNWPYGLTRDSHGENYVYVERKDDKMARRETT